MKLALIREAERRKPVASAAALGAEAAEARGLLALSQFCMVSRNVSHYRCDSTWCECPCHAEEMKDWYG